MSAEPMHLLAKLAEIRRLVKRVDKKSGGGEDRDPFTYAPAEAVFDAIRTQLRLRKVVALPVRSKVLDRDASSVGRGGATFQAKAIQVELTVVFYDEEAPEQSYRVQWVGEGDDAVKASTSALKGLMLATFLVRTSEPEPRDRHEKRAGEVKDNRAMSPNQRKRLIKPLATEAGLGDLALLNLASEVAGTSLSDLDSFPADRVDDLVGALNKAKAV